MTKIETYLTKIKVKLITGYPFLSNLLLNLSLKEDNSILTMATDGKVILYNTKFVESLKMEETAFVLCHEALHAALNHLWRRGTRNPTIFNYAADYVVNSILVEASKHEVRSCKLAMPKVKGKEIGLYDIKFKNWPVEQVYKYLMDNNVKVLGSLLDDHSSWSGTISSERDNSLADKWKMRLSNAVMTSKAHGSETFGVEIQMQDLIKPQKDWRQLLAEFIEEENNDYSFMPSDKRYSETDFYMPDFNDTIEIVKDIYFFVDTSGSMSDKELNVCFSEIQGAINQFKNRLCGKLVFFDTKCYTPIDFDDVNGDISKIKPVGRGGTSFDAPFDFLNEHPEFDVSGIIILTDGECTYPDERKIPDKKLLWIYTTYNNNPPYGFHTTLEVEKGTR